MGATSARAMPAKSSHAAAAMKRGARLNRRCTIDETLQPNAPGHCEHTPCARAQPRQTSMSFQRLLTWENVRMPIREQRPMIANGYQT